MRSFKDKRQSVTGDFMLSQSLFIFNQKDEKASRVLNTGANPYFHIQGAKYENSNPLGPEVAAASPSRFRPQSLVSRCP